MHARLEWTALEKMTMQPNTWTHEFIYNLEVAAHTTPFEDSKQWYLVSRNVQEDQTALATHTKIWATKGIEE